MKLVVSLLLSWCVVCTSYAQSQNIHPVFQQNDLAHQNGGACNWSLARDYMKLLRYDLYALPEASKNISCWWALDATLTIDEDGDVLSNDTVIANINSQEMKRKNRHFIFLDHGTYDISWTLPAERTQDEVTIFVIGGKTAFSSNAKNGVMVHLGGVFDFVLENPSRSWTIESYDKKTQTWTTYTVE